MDDTPDQLNDNLAQQIQLKSELYHDEILLTRLQQQAAPESATLDQRLTTLQADYDTKKAEAASLHQMLKQDTTLNHEERCDRHGQFLASENLVTAVRVRNV